MTVHKILAGCQNSHVCHMVDHQFLFLMQNHNSKITTKIFSLKSIPPYHIPNLLTFQYIPNLLTFQYI